MTHEAARVLAATHPPTHTPTNALDCGHSPDRSNASNTHRLMVLSSSWRRLASTEPTDSEAERGRREETGGGGGGKEGNTHRDQKESVVPGAEGRREWGVTDSRMQKCSGTRGRCWLHKVLSILNITRLHSLSGLKW